MKSYDLKSYEVAQPDIKVAVVVTKTCFHLMSLTRYHNCLFKIYIQQDWQQVRLHSRLLP